MLLDILIPLGCFAFGVWVFWLLPHAPPKSPLAVLAGPDEDDLRRRRAALRRERERKVLGLHGTQAEADALMRRMAEGD
jgi:hypothetical protein